MISSPLFRPGDQVHYINNLTTGHTYPMIHRPGLDCRIGEYANSWCRDHSGNAVEIITITPSGTYVVDAAYGACDALYQEAARVGAYLLNTPMPLDVSSFNFVTYDLSGDNACTHFSDDWIAATDWNEMAW